MKLAVYLIDGSGSMKVAWFAAFDTLFRELKKLSTPALLLAFQQNEVANKAIVAQGEYAALVNIADLMRQKSIVIVKKAPTPEEVGFEFRGQTPLLEAIILVMDLVAKRFSKVETTLHIFTDNRDSLVLKYADYARKYNNDKIAELKRKYGIKLVAHLMGDALLKHLDIYDETRLEVNPNLLRLI